MRFLDDLANDLADDLRARVARRLERGDGGAIAHVAAGGWAALSARGIARPVTLPEGAWVIGVGSAVLGGAGKTPLAIALARSFDAGGERVAIIGHAYRAKPRRARRVELADGVAEVGDDALAAARLTADTGVGVVVAPHRNEALDHAMRLGFRVLVVDGLLQTAPRRLDASILVLDTEAPWGSGACPPAGDLRAPCAALLAVADVVAVVGGAPDGRDPRPPAGAVAVPSEVDAAIDASGRRVDLAELAGRRVGLLLTVARPERVVRALHRAGVVPSPVIALGDHASPSSRDLATTAAAGVEAWLTTARCAVKLPAAIGAAPVLALVHRLDVRSLMKHPALRTRDRLT